MAINFSDGLSANEVRQLEWSRPLSALRIRNEGAVIGRDSPPYATAVSLLYYEVLQGRSTPRQTFELRGGQGGPLLASFPAKTGARGEFNVSHPNGVWLNVTGSKEPDPVDVQFHVLWPGTP